jgi:hypothetical protein
MEESGRDHDGPTEPSLQQPRKPHHRMRSRFPWGTAIVAIFVVIACIGGLYFFSGAKVEIVPTANTGTVSGSFTATPSSGDLPFILVNVQKTANEDVKAESTVSANDTAQGRITVYNTQSKPQQLIKNTRFATPEGLIFRIHDSVSVPAATGENPGSLVVDAYADSPGQTYNIPPSSFVLPGLANTPQAAQVYGKSTEAFVGGFSGTRPAVSQATDDAEHAKLQAALDSQISETVTAQVPSGYALIPGSIRTSYSSLPDTAGANGMVTVKEQATATAIVFPLDALARAVAGEVIGATYANQPVTMKSVQGLTLTPKDTLVPSATEPYSFNLTGSATVIWSVDTQKISGAVAGKSRAAAQSVLTGFPEISRAILTLRPFWLGSFPSDPSNIKVTVSEPK